MKKLTILFVLLAACRPPTAPLAPDGGETCETACQNLERMGCEAGRPSDGTSCAELCGELVDFGAPYPVVCATRATSCEAADRCR